VTCRRGEERIDGSIDMLIKQELSSSWDGRKLSWTRQSSTGNSQC